MERTPVVRTGTVAPPVGRTPVGTLWFNRKKGKLFILYPSNNAKQWIEVLAPIRPNRDI
jgi:hypothetical protein